MDCTGLPERRQNLFCRAGRVWGFVGWAPPTSVERLWAEPTLQECPVPGPAVQALPAFPPHRVATERRPRMERPRGLAPTFRSALSARNDHLPSVIYTPN